MTATTKSGVKVVKRPKDIKLVVKRQVNKKYRVTLESDPNITQSGKTRSSAIANLILLNPDVFGITVVREEDETLPVVAGKPEKK